MRSHAAADTADEHARRGVPLHDASCQEHPSISMHASWDELSSQGATTPEHELLEEFQKHPSWLPHWKLEKISKHEMLIPEQPPPVLEQPAAVQEASSAQGVGVPRQEGATLTSSGLVESGALPESPASSIDGTNVEPVSGALLPPLSLTLSPVAPLSFTLASPPPVSGLAALHATPNAQDKSAKATFL